MGGIDALNAGFSAATHEAVADSKGPLWVRDFAVGKEEKVCPELETTLKMVNARRMVVGHTQVKEGLVQQRCGGRLLMADTTISKNGYPEFWDPNSRMYRLQKGSASYVEFPDNGEAKAVCASGHVCVTPSVTFESVSFFFDNGDAKGQSKDEAEDIYA